MKIKGLGLKIFFLFCVFFFNKCGTSSSPEYLDSPIKEIEVKSFVDLSQYLDIIKIGRMFSCSSIAMDHEGNLYLLDIKNSRIIKISKAGEEIGQIGSIGQEKEDLYNPAGVFIQDGTIYVLNDKGREVKALSLDNHFLRAFKIDNCWMTGSLLVYGNFILTAERTANANNYNKTKLLSVRTKNGELKRSFGKITKSNSQIGYLMFNDIFLQLVDNRIFGAFKYYPVIFAYDFGGRELYYKNLSSSVTEIKDLNARVKDKGFDTPDTYKEEDDFSYRGVQYCFGFGVDKKINIYYALWVGNNLQTGYLLLCLNGKGDVIERIMYKKDDSVIRIEAIFTDHKNRIHIIGFIDKQVIWFKFKE